MSGLKNSKKRHNLFYWLRKRNSDIVFLQETHCHSSNFEYKWSREWDGQSVWAYGTNNSKGVAVLFNRNYAFNFKTICKDTDGRLIVVDLDIQDKQFRLINVYAPNLPSERCKFITSKVKPYTKTDREIIYGGDHNCILDLDLDKTNVACYPTKLQNKSQPGKDTKEMLDLMSCANLEDIWRRRNPTSVKYTWNHKGKNLGSRIDYWLISKSLDYSVKKVNIIEIPYSDHSAVTLDINLSEMKRGKGFWKLSSYVVNSKLFKEKFGIFWNEWKESRHLHDNLSIWWDLTKIKIKQLAIWCSVQLSYKQNKEIEYIEAQLDRETVLEKKESISNSLRQLYQKKCEGARVRSRIKWYEEGETSSKYFHDLEKKRCKDKLWTAILDENGVLKHGTENVLKRQIEYYKKLYKEEPTSYEKQQFFLSNITKTLSQTSYDYLEEPLSLDEQFFAVKAMKMNKSPGPDGLTSEFYQVFWNVISPIFMEVISYIFEHGELTFSQYQAIISLLYKKGIREDIGNWRPISLLNCDYKIITKVLAHRLKKVVHEMIHEDQRGCIKGRHGFDCLRILEDVIENGVDEDSCILLLDQEKAFDRVDKNWMFSVLKQFGFGENFLKWLRILYKNASSAILTNGYISEFFRVGRGFVRETPSQRYFTLYKLNH